MLDADAREKLMIALVLTVLVGLILVVAFS
jgi:hypothetical protein